MDLRRVDGQLRADQIAEAAVHAIRLLALRHHGVVISLGVDVVRVHQDLGGTVGDAEIALLAALSDDVHASPWNLGQGQVHRLSPEIDS